jgi:hypothetical protein
MPPPTMSISGRTPSNSGETGPPVFGRADAEGVALAVALALMLVDELLLADALDIALALEDMAEDEALDIVLGLDMAEADALGLIIAEADALGLDIALAEDEALDIALAEDEALDIICELLIICPLGIMCIPFICCAIAAAAKANTATIHRAANKRNFLKMPPSVAFPSPGSTCTFPREQHDRQTSKPPSIYVSRPCYGESKSYNHESRVNR